MKLEISTKNLNLRCLNSSEAQSVYNFYIENFDFLSKWEVNLNQKFLNISYIEKLLEYEFKDCLRGNSIRYYFFLKDNPHKIIGSVNFSSIRHHGFNSCQIGYKVSKLFARQHLTSEAVKASILSMQENENLHRIEAMIALENIPSIAFATSIGFINEGICRDYIKINNIFKDCYRFSLLSGELKL